MSCDSLLSSRTSSLMFLMAMPGFLGIWCLGFDLLGCSLTTCPLLLNLLGQCPERNWIVDFL
eukprot:7122877-Prorocentrum_lima.AAC.1